MERREFGERPYPGGPPGVFSGQIGTAEDDLIARSREWMNRPDRDRDPWRRSVDDFLGDRNFKHKVSNSRERSPRDRSRERKDKRRTSSRERERRGSPRRRSVEEDESRDYRRFGVEGGREKQQPQQQGGGWGGDERAGRGRGRPGGWADGDRWNGGEPRRWRRDDEEEGGEFPENNSWLTVDSWSRDDDDNSSTCDKSEHEFDITKFYGSEINRGEDRFTYKKQTAQKTIIIRGLAQHITESDIRTDIMSSGINFKDIRLVRRKDTGASRGFAFVEFFDIADATKWIEMKQGELMLKDHFRALLQYSLQKEGNFSKERWMADWYCRCQAHNFRRRVTCYRCNLSRKHGEVMEGNDEISAHPTNTVLLRGLDALSTEESVLQSIKTLSSLPIRSVRIGRDPATNASRGVCYLEMNSVVDSMYLFNSLSSSTPVIDNRTVLISYAKLDPLTLHSSASLSGHIANTAVAAAQWSHQKPDGNSSSCSTQHYTLSDVPRLAEYSAALYATNPQEKSSYLTYYEDYYKKQITDGNKISLPANTTDSSDGGWAGAQAAYAAVLKGKATSASTALSEAPDGSGNKVYPTPDVSSYQYDKSSSYYYDPFTTLYYDANSQYYYNNKLSKFLYWDATKSTYLPAPTQNNQKNTQDQPESKEEEKKKEKEVEKDKVKVAKRIAKDMEKWAKTLNHKKEIAKQNIVAAQQAAVANMKAVGSADIGYAVLERKELTTTTPLLLNSLDPQPYKNESLVAAYGQGSDSEDDGFDEAGVFDERQHLDLSKMACLLCKRQFPNKDILMKHVSMSDLHKQNLASWYKSKGIDMDDSVSKKQYRDRAKERRLKYGEPDTPQPNRLKETYMKAREAAINYEEPTKDGIGSDNLGSKLLQKMGWQEGMGLGKANQGRTNIIQAERRSATAGLGTKSVGVTPGPGETYKDCVKKMMQIRYNEIDQ